MIIKSFHILLFTYHLITSTNSSNPCEYKKCKPNEVSCLELVPEFSTFLCKCSRYCKRIKLDDIDLQEEQQLSPIMDVIDEHENATIDYSQNDVALVKKDGPACSPFTCINGGVCYTTYNEVAKKGCSTPLSANKDCLLLGPEQTICTCQPGFFGEKCHLQMESFDLCQNINMCVNGGRCIPISYSKFQCICPFSFAGKYCETLIFTACPNINNSIVEGAPLCHPDNGFCTPEGACVCKAGFSGPSCNEVQTNSLKMIKPRTCSLDICNGNGICITNQKNSVVTCLCDSYHTGQYCETFFNMPNTTPITSQTSITSSSSPPEPTSPSPISLFSTIKAKRKLRNKIKRVKHKMLILNKESNH